VKIHHTSSGVKSHFIKVDENKMCIQIFKNLKSYETGGIAMKEILFENFL